MTSFIDDSGNELDYDGKDFAITKQALTFYSFQFKGDTSVNIKVPKTTKNKTIFSNFGIQQVSPLALITINVFRNGNKVNRGQLVISEITETEIECYFISGNSSWFKLWSFNCNEIVTTKYDVAYGWENARYSIEETWGNTDGIIFPVIDWAFGGEQGSEEHFGILNCYVGDGAQLVTGNDHDFVQMIFPCLYIHTLLKLLSNHAGTTITGDIFNDKFFRTIVITPNGPSSFRSSEEDSTLSKTVKPEDIAPQIKASDLLKWVAASFGCIVTFDNDANQISVNKIVGKNKADAVDWSVYYIKHELQYSKFYDSNNISYKKNSQSDIASYDAVNTTPYAGLLVDSIKNDNSVNKVYEAPFMASYDTVGTNTLKFATPDVDFYRFTDGDGYAFTSVTFVGGGAVVFNGTGFPWVNSGNELIVRIQCDNNIYSGYWIMTSGTTTTIQAKFAVSFRGNSTGIIYVQSVQYNDAGHKVLSCLTNVSPSTFCQYSTIYFPQVLGVGARTSVAYAYFHKSLTQYSLLNQYIQGLSYGSISGRKDASLSQTYLSPLVNILMNPPIRAKFLLPEQKVGTYDYSYVYIRAHDIDGYFLVEKIENFEESDIEVWVNIVKVD